MTRLDRLDRDSRAYAEYAATVRRLVETDDRFRAARAAWTEFLVAGHGDALADVALDDPATELFVDALYYDRVVDRLTAAVEDATGVALANREPDAAGPVDLGTLHDRAAAAGAAVPEVGPDVLPGRDGTGPGVDGGRPADDDGTLRDAGTDPLGDLYESVVAREIRQALGQFYTPRGVAALAVDALDVADPAAATVLDPGCGSGVFLAVCVDRVVEATADADPAATLARATRAVRGVDVDPVAVRAAKLRYLLALRPVLAAADVDSVTVPVALADALAVAGEGVPTYGPDHAPDGDPTVDHLVGNPPWLPWSRLPEAARERWRERHVEDLDLLPHAGAAARLGHANDDIAVPYVWVCVDRYLREGGRAAFVLKRGATKGPAGRLLRQLRVGDRPLALTRVHAFDGPGPFDVGADAAVYAFAADTDHEFPVPATVWRRGDGEGGDAGDGEDSDAGDGEGSDAGDGEGSDAGGGEGSDAGNGEGDAGNGEGDAGNGEGDAGNGEGDAGDGEGGNAGGGEGDAGNGEGDAAGDEGGHSKPDFSTGPALRASLSAEETGLVPVDPDEPASTWVRADAERAALGECAHDVRHGLKDDAAAVYGLDREDLADVEPALVYPYLRSRHVRRYGVDGHDLRLVPMRTAGEDNEAWLREEYPETYAYLQDHRDRLEARSSSWLDDGPFYSVFGLGEYTWADYKVVWCRLGFRPEFAVVSTATDPDVGEKPVVPGDHYMFVATDREREAHLLCALLNSAPYRRSMRALGGAGKASLTKAVVSELALPAWPGSGADGSSAADGPIDVETAGRLAELSMAAHGVVAEGMDDEGNDTGEEMGDGGDLDALQAEIDETVEEWLASGR